jgi:hypothetical protein
MISSEPEEHAMRKLIPVIAALALMTIPLSANAAQRYHGGGHYSGHSSGRYYGGGGHYGHYDHGHSNFSFGLSFGFGGPYYRDSYYAPDYTYYRPVYRPYYPPPVYYDAPVYAPAPVYIPARHYYYRNDCNYYYRPSVGFGFTYGRYHYR